MLIREVCWRHSEQNVGLSRHRDVDDPGNSQMSVPMAGFGLVDTIVNRANERRPRLPPLRFPSSFFLLIHPSRSIPVNPVACHGSFEFSHRKPPKSDRERTVPLLALALSQDRDRRPETLTVIKLSIIDLLSDQQLLPFFAFFSLLFLCLFFAGNGRTSRTLPLAASRLPGQKENGKAKNNKGVCKSNLPLNPLIVAPDL